MLSSNTVFLLCIAHIQSKFQRYPGLPGSPIISVLGKSLLILEMGFPGVFRNSACVRKLRLEDYTKAINFMMQRQEEQSRGYQSGFTNHH